MWVGMMDSSEYKHEPFSSGKGVSTRKEYTYLVVSG